MSQPCPLEMFGPTSKLRSTLNLRYLIVIEVSLELPFFRLPKVTFSTTTTSKFNPNNFTVHVEQTVVSTVYLICSNDINPKIHQCTQSFSFRKRDNLRCL